MLHSLYLIQTVMLELGIEKLYVNRNAHIHTYTSVYTCVNNISNTYLVCGKFQLILYTICFKKEKHINKQY